MSKLTKDASTGWYGIAIGVFFIALASPALFDILKGRPPSFVVKSVLLSGSDAVLASALSTLVGLGFIGAGLWRFWRRRT